MTISPRYAGWEKAWPDSTDNRISGQGYEFFMIQWCESGIKTAFL
mgnify:CR=1 FL=1